MEFEFDLQRFKGSKAKVIAPDEYGGDLAQLMANNTFKTSDMATHLLNVANDTLGVMQSDYGGANGLHATAQERENWALEGLKDQVSSNWDLATITDDRFMELADKYQQNADKYSGMQ